MPGIWNINNGYNINSKKISSKLTFEVGEKFTGKVVSKGDGKDVTIKLSDGWQFIAEVEGKVNFEELKLVKFEVNGFENGKLKLKIVNEGVKETVDVDDNFQEIIDKEGLSKEDISILKKMINHNISLTRDNINEIKGLFQFNGKINIDPDAIDSFVQKYILSKNIELDSEQGRIIKDVLTKFLNGFKNMNENDILTFIENNIEFSEDNINSFNKLFKGDLSIEKILINMKNELDGMDFTKDISQILNKEINTTDELINSKMYKNIQDASNTALASKAYAENDPVNKKIDVLDLLKTLAAANDNKDASVSKNVEFKNNIIKDNGFEILDNSLLEKLNDKELLKLIKDSIGEKLVPQNEPKTQASNLIESTNKAKLEEILSKVDGKEVKLTDNEFKKINEFINKNAEESSKEVIQKDLDNKSQNFFKKDIVVDNLKDNLNSKNNISKLDSLVKSNLENAEAIKADIKSKIENVKDIVKRLVNQIDIKDASYDKIINMVKGNINDFKVFNSISNEYYYLNLNVSAQNNEYPCKLIIKDNRKDGKKIDKTNTKMIVSVKTINLGEIDGYLTLSENRIDVNIKCNDEFNMVIKNKKNQLVNGLSTLGLLASVSVSSKEHQVNLSNCRNFFNDITISAIDIKV